MPSARTQISYLSPSLSNQPPSNTRRKLRKEERDRGGNVLPSGSGTGYGQTNGFGYTSAGYAHGGSYNGLSGAAAAASSGLESGFDHNNGWNGGDRSSSTGSGAHIVPRLQATVAQAKAKHREHRSARQAKRQGDGVTRRNMVMDEHGVAHDSEYVQFRTATPAHEMRARSSGGGEGGGGRKQNGRMNGLQDYPDEDGSASSSSSSSHSSSSSASGFPSSPYTYQSTHRSASTHHYPNTLGSTASAIPSHMLASSEFKGSRSSYDNQSVMARAAVTPIRTASLDYDRTGYGASSLRPPSLSTTMTGGNSKSRLGSSNVATRETPHFTTSSYQPPAPAFSPRPMDFSTSLRLPYGKAVSSADGNSLSESAARLSITERGKGTSAGGGGGSGSGYDRFARENSSRPPQLDGSALDAGVHGMKRSWDGFKLEMKFGAHKAGKKVVRKINNI